MIELRKASTKAIRFACTHFHYAKRVPAVSFAYNVYENSQWCGVIIFSPGATVNIAKMFDCVQGEVLELVRIALNGRQSKTSQCVAMALRKLHRDAPYVKIVVSYADQNQGHIGQKYHPRSLHSKGYRQSVEWLRENVDPNASECFGLPKHKYIFVFDKRLKRKLQKKALPYPKEVEGNDNSTVETQNQSGV